jgi:hypothetical protein
LRKEFTAKNQVKTLPAPAQILEYKTHENIPTAQNKDPKSGKYRRTLTASARATCVRRPYTPQVSSDFYRQIP